jgi:O-antigen ligase
MVYWFILLFPLLIYPWGIERYYTMTKFAYLQIFVVVMWLTIIWRRKSWEIDWKKPHLSIEAISIVFLCLVGLSTIFSVNQYVSIYGRLGRQEGLLAFMCYVSIMLFSYKFIPAGMLKKVVPGIAVVSVFVSIYGILQHYFLDFLPRTPLYYHESRSYGFFDNPNFFGSYLVLVIMLTISVYLSAMKKGHERFYFITLCLAFAALIFSQTRSGWVGVFFGMVFVSFFVVRKRRNLWRKWLVLISSFALIFIGINFSEKGSVYGRLMTLYSDSYRIVADQSDGSEGSFRLFIWKKSLPLVPEYFWVGSGPDTFDVVFPDDDEKRKVFGEMIVDKAHNEYLQMAITLGVPALAVYLWLVFVVLRRSFQTVRGFREEEKIHLYGFISAIIGYLVQAFFNISVVPVAPLFWALLGITAASAELGIGKK